MAGKKVTRFQPSPQEPEAQRFIDFEGARCFYWRYARLVDALELLAAEPPEEKEQLAAAMSILAEIGNRLRGQLALVMHETYTVGPGETVKEIPAPV